MLHYAYGIKRSYGSVCRMSRQSTEVDCSSLSIITFHKPFMSSIHQLSVSKEVNFHDDLLHTSRMHFGRGAAPSRDFRGGFGAPSAPQDAPNPVGDFNRYENDSRLLMEIVQKFPIDGDGKIKPLQVPQLMSELHEDAQEALGKKGGLLKFLRDRGQLFIVKRAPVEGKKDVMAYFCVATKVAAKICSQRKEQLEELREGKDMHLGGGQKTFSQNAAAASGAGFRGAGQPEGFGRGAPRGGFGRGAASHVGGGFGHGGSPSFGRGGGFQQSSLRGGFQSPMARGRGGPMPGHAGRGGFGAPSGGEQPGRFGGSSQGRFSNF